MKALTILEIKEVFQIEGRGTVVMGVMGQAWKLLKVGDEIILRTAAGEEFKTAVKDFDVPRRGLLDRMTAPTHGAIVLADLYLAHQLPSGTHVIRADSIFE